MSTSTSTTTDDPAPRPAVPVTPFIRKILTLVAAHCEPAAGGWSDRLAGALHEAFYTVVRPGDVVSADHVNALHFRLMEVEPAVSPAASGAAGSPGPDLNYTTSPAASGAAGSPGPHGSYTRRTAW